MSLSRIEFDAVQKDYLINGKSLLQHLEENESISPKAYLPAILCQAGVVDRLSGYANPDLIENHVAIYLCGDCGGYDGNPIGIKLDINAQTVSWTEMGYYEEFDEGLKIPFKNITAFTFDLEQYMDFLKSLKVQETSTD